MLSQVVKPGKASGAVALEGTFAGMFPDVTSQMLASGKTEVAWRIVGAIKPLRLLLLRLCAIPVDALIVRRGPVIGTMPFAIGIINVHVIRVFRRSRVL